MKPEMLHHEDYAEPLDRSPKVRRASGSIMGSFSRVPQSYEDRLFPNIDPLKSSGKGMDLKGMNVKALEGKTRRESSEIEKRKGSLDAEKRKESLESAKSSLKSPHDVNSMKNSFVKSPNDPIMRSKTPPRDKMSSSPGRKELASPRKTSAEIQDQGRGPKPTSKAERRALQDSQRAEKAARSGAQSARQSIHSGNPSTRQSTAANQNARQSSAGASRSKPNSQADLFATAPRTKKNAKKVIEQDVKQCTLLSHLPPFEKDYKIINEAQAQGLIHPAVISLGLHIMERTIMGGNARCMAMMLTFKKVISDYNTPPGLSLQRDLTQHISRQVDFLTKTRSLAASMKTAIRSLKTAVTTLSIDIPDADAKSLLCVTIDDFINMRITLAAQGIYDNVLDNGKIKNGDVLMVYARSSVVLGLLIASINRKISFSVIVVDSRPFFEGSYYWVEDQKI